MSKMNNRYRIANGLGVESMAELYRIENEIVSKLSHDLVVAKEKVVKDRFRDVTGEELTVDNVKRVHIELPLYHSIDDKREIYKVDNTAVLEVYATHPTSYEEQNTWKITYKQNYRLLNTDKYPPL